MSEDLHAALLRIEEKLNSIIRILEGRTSPAEDVDSILKNVNPSSRGVVNIYLLKLPDSLKQTMLAMAKLNEASTTDVAETTGRSRSVESIHLNQLERMGYIEKCRRGRKIFFKIPTPSE